MLRMSSRKYQKKLMDVCPMLIILLLYPGQIEASCHDYPRETKKSSKPIQQTVIDQLANLATAIQRHFEEVNQLQKRIEIEVKETISQKTVRLTECQLRCLRDFQMDVDTELKETTTKRTTLATSTKLRRPSSTPKRNPTNSTESTKHMIPSNRNWWERTTKPLPFSSTTASIRSKTTRSTTMLTRRISTAYSTRKTDTFFATTAKPITTSKLTTVFMPIEATQAISTSNQKRKTTMNSVMRSTATEKPARRISFESTKSGTTMTSHSTQTTLRLRHTPSINAVTDRVEESTKKVTSSLAISTKAGLATTSILSNLLTTPIKEQSGGPSTMIGLSQKFSTPFSYAAGVQVTTDQSEEANMIKNTAVTKVNSEKATKKVFNFRNFTRPPDKKRHLLSNKTSRVSFKPKGQTTERKLSQTNHNVQSTAALATKVLKKGEFTQQYKKFTSESFKTSQPTATTNQRNDYTQTDETLSTLIGKTSKHENLSHGRSTMVGFPTNSQTKNISTSFFTTENKQTEFNNLTTYLPTTIAPTTIAPKLKFPCGRLTTGVIYMTDLPSEVYIESGTPVQCENGWLVIQRRFLPYELNMNRSWAEYKAGFGKITTPRSEFWLGLELLRKIVIGQDYRLRMVVTTQNLKTVWVEYRGFEIGPESDGYRLHVKGPAIGTIGTGDVFNCFKSAENGMKFSALDKDNDFLYPHRLDPPSNCASFLGGGWWYRSCGNVLLNSNYHVLTNTVSPGAYISYFNCDQRAQNTHLLRTGLFMRPIRRRRRG